MNQRELIESTGMTCPAIAKVLNVKSWTVSDWKLERVKMPEEYRVEVQKISDQVKHIRSLFHDAKLS